MKVLTVFGTRPEAIKMAPVVRTLAQTEGVRVSICLTGQHRDMLAGVLEMFDLRADHNLAIMKPGQDLAYITAAVLTGLEPIFNAERPDWVLVHGDTTTAMAGAMAAFYRGYSIGHVEAGLRTHDLHRPWPEEMNRSVIDRIATLRFAPTIAARDNLLRENIPAEAIVVTGNTVIDALQAVLARIEADQPLQRAFGERFAFLVPGRPLVLVTGHRRESFGAGFQRICRALRRLAEPGDLDIVYPVHLNPNVQEPVRRLLGGLSNMHLLEPLDYAPFVYLMARCDVILTDSGGIQEEAPSLGKPVLIMRDVTERPEAVSEGIATLVGTDERGIYHSVREALRLPKRGVAAANPYGDGCASIRIRDALLCSKNDRGRHRLIFGS